MGFPLFGGSPTGCVLSILDVTAVGLCSLLRATNDKQSPNKFTRDTYSGYPDNSQIIITAQFKAAAAACPQCGVISRRIHSYYRRSGKDLPIGGQITNLHLEATRFRCMNDACCKRTFSERTTCLGLPQ